MSETESFESVASSYDKFTWIGRDGVKRAIDRLKAAHDREIRDTAQREYDRGFHAGEHSMDAEHRAVAMRLRGLRFDGGSHENLSQIARAIYHADFGWTQGACASLRDELVRLMGGVSDDGCTGCGCAAADCDGDCGLQREEVTDERLADDCGADTGCGDGGGDLHMAGLDEERRRVVAELRKMPNGYPEYASAPFAKWYAELCEAIGVETGFDNVRDRLIHLLGGNQPSGIDVLRAMDGESDTDGTCPNDVPTSSITDELRECVYTATKTYDDTPWHEMGGDSNADHTICYVTEGELLRIADRIDEQFERICKQHEVVLQSTIDDMAGEIDKMRKEVIELREQRHNLQRECEELQEKLDEHRGTVHLDALSDENLGETVTHLRIEKLVEQRDAARARTDELSDELLRTRRERDELRAKLAIIRETIDG